MRIIGGTGRGRKLAAPGSLEIRPTTDRAREALFNILGPAVVDSRVLDLFAGTGALGLEALSRGARSALFVDGQQRAVALINENIELCGFSNRSVVVQRDLGQGLSFLREEGGQGFELILADPPYGLDLGPQLLAEIVRLDLLVGGGLVVVEDQAGMELPEKVGALGLVDQRRYGDTGFWFFRHF